MASPTPSREKQVRLTAFDNEPMARLAEQRLGQIGIPCLIRPLRGGPGLWGSAYNLPHDLLVCEVDAAQAREVLGLEPAQPAPEYDPDRAGGSGSNKGSAMVGALLVVGLLIMAVLLFPRWG